MWLKIKHHMLKKQLYLKKLYKQTTLIPNRPQYATSRQQVSQNIAPISRRRHQPPIMIPYFKPPRYRNMSMSHRNSHSSTSPNTTIISTRCFNTIIRTTCITYCIYYSRQIINPSTSECSTSSKH